MEHMLRTVARVLMRWPFFMLGLATLAVLRAVEVGTLAPGPLRPALRVLIAPLWLGRTIEVALLLPLLDKTDGLWRMVVEVAGLPLLFAPYLLGDLLLRWLRAVVRAPLVPHPPSNQALAAGSRERSN